MNCFMVFYGVYTSIGVNKYFLHSQMTSCSMQYDIIYHPFPISSEYLKVCVGGGGIDSPAIVLENGNSRIGRVLGSLVQYRVLNCRGA